MQLLLESGADMGAQDHDHNTPLHIAALQGKVAAAQMLLKHHARFDAWNKHCHTPLQVASQEGYTDIIQLLSRKASEVRGKLGSSQSVPSIMSI